MIVTRRVYFAFVDLGKAYGRVFRTKLWNVLHEYEVDEWLVNVLEAIYDGHKACARLNEMHIDYFVIKHGVK